MARVVTPRRGSLSVSLQLDKDAYELMKEMCGNKSRGAFVSGLIRAEHARQHERWKLRKKGLPGIELEMAET